MRIRLSGLFAVALAATACVTTQQETAPVKEDPFAGCEAYPGGTGGVQLRCGNILATSNVALNFTPDQLLESYLNGLRLQSEATGSGFESEESAFKLSGEDRPSRAFRMFRPADGRTLLRGHAIATTTKNEGARVITCSAPVDVPNARERCRSMLEVLVVSGVPKDLRTTAQRVQGAPAIMGREVAIPAGCRALDSTGDRSTIVCGDKSEDASFTWFKVGPNVGSQLIDLMVQQIVTGLGPTANAQVEKTACQVEGASADCRRVSGRDALGDFKLLAASANVQGSDVVAMCSYHGDQPHPVCNNVFGEQVPQSAPESAPAESAPAAVAPQS